MPDPLVRYREQKLKIKIPQISLVTAQPSTYNVRITVSGGPNTMQSISITASPNLQPIAPASQTKVQPASPYSPANLQSIAAHPPTKVQLASPYPPKIPTGASKNPMVQPAAPLLNQTARPARAPSLADLHLRLLSAPACSYNPISPFGVHAKNVR
jgi:hypothetical protein